MSDEDNELEKKKERAEFIVLVVFFYVLFGLMLIAGVWVLLIGKTFLDFFAGTLVTLFSLLVIIGAALKYR